MSKASSWAPARALLHPLAKPLLFGILLLPLARLVHALLNDALGPNPAEALSHATGVWALRLLIATLTITPLRHVTGWTTLQRFRRMLGLFSFFYAVLHLLTYAWLDQGWAIGAIVTDIGKRPFILLGMLSLLLMLPLAATSTNRAIKRLGVKRWQALHRLVYAVAVGTILHFVLMLENKQGLREVAPYALMVAVLLGWRLMRRLTGPSPPR